MNPTSLKRYADARAWWRATLKHSVHNALGAVLSIAGTNAIEGASPAALQHYVEGIGLNFEQGVAVFLVTFGISVLRSVHAATAPGETRAPFPSP